MKIWLPYLRSETGTDVFTEVLAESLVTAGHHAISSAFDRRWEFFPWPLRFTKEPTGTEIVLVNSWNGFAFRRRGCKLVVVEHLCVFDPAFTPYRSPLQAMYHEALIRRFEGASLKAADAVVTVSGYTARSLQAAFGGPAPRVIPNAVDTSFFCPSAEAPAADEHRDVRLLFVGNLTRRKGADLLPKIMAKLGHGFELSYTRGTRDDDPYVHVANMRSLGRLDRDQIRLAYREADIVVFPTRLEGFGYTAAEAMACATPVVASASSSLPEIVGDGVTGRLCPVDDVDAFASAIRDLAADRDALRAMGDRARAVAVAKFGLDRWRNEYLALFESLIGP